MQLTLRVNNGNTVKGAVGGKGVLGVSITVFAPAEGNEPTGKAMIRAFESSKVSEWRADDLSIGGKVEIHLLPDGEADSPTSTVRGSDAPMFLFSDPSHARNALAALHICNQQLQGILRAAKYAESHDEALKIQTAVANVVRHLGTHLITPTVKRHPELVSEAKELGLLD